MVSDRSAVLSVRSKIRAVGSVRRDGEQHQVRLLRRRKELADVERLGGSVAGGNVERQAVGEHPARMKEGDAVVANCVRVELATGQPVWREEQTRDRELDRILEVAALR